MRILYIDIDSLRPRHLGCYGYRRATSSNIDALARQGCVVEGLYASDVPCLPSRTAFFGGHFGTSSGVVNHGGLCADVPPEGHSRDFRSRWAENSLASRLAGAGYRTASISPFPRRHSAYQTTWGFHETFDTGKGGLENAEEIFEPAADWIRRNLDKDDWFLHINFWDPHTPYDTPEAFGNPFADDPLEPWLTQEVIDRQRASYGPHSAREVPHITPDLPRGWRWGVGEIRDPVDAKVHIDGYDTGIRYVDGYVGRLLDLVGDDVAVIVSADHGENLGELNVWGDHQTADEFTCHIPCVVRWPGVAGPGSRLPGLRYHLDLAATILEMAGASVKGWTGQSFASFAGSGREQLFLSQGAWSLQRAVRFGDMIYIKTLHAGLKDFPKHMLFNLVDDPHETTNLASAQSSLVGAKERELDDWFARTAESCPYGDPFQIVLDEGGPYHANERSKMWGDYLSRLETSGRAHHAATLCRLGGAPAREF
ncbi:MAG TPA: sulfatase [Fimbriimonadaceae bacterium]|nr:sulfatase [Fimbriimonadaceae bacterium]